MSSMQQQKYLKRQQRRCPPARSAARILSQLLQEEGTPRVRPEGMPLREWRSKGHASRRVRRKALQGRAATNMLDLNNVRHAVFLLHQHFDFGEYLNKRRSRYVWQNFVHDATPHCHQKRLPKGFKGKWSDYCVRVAQTQFDRGTRSRSSPIARPRSRGRYAKWVGRVCERVLGTSMPGSQASLPCGFRSLDTAPLSQRCGLLFVKVGEGVTTMVMSSTFIELLQRGRRRYSMFACNVLCRDGSLITVPAVVTVPANTIGVRKRTAIALPTADLPEDLKVRFLQSYLETLQSIAKEELK